MTDTRSSKTSTSGLKTRRKSNMASELKKITGLFTPDKGKETKTVLSGKCSTDVFIPAGSRVMMFKNDPAKAKNPNGPPYSLVFAEPDGYVRTPPAQPAQEARQATAPTTGGPMGDGLPF